jgi:hypothetical protein
MVASFPFLTTYDPAGTSEGALDPLGLYQIADQLAVQLVPGVRERMQRIRFLTAMAVGALVTEDLHDNSDIRDASPYLVWEWLVVEALMRTRADETGVWGIPGSLVARRALSQHGYLDARSYLKTPRIFGFHGVYKRLAIRLRLVDVHLGTGPNTEALVDAWARSIGFGGLKVAKPLLSSWTNEVKRCLNEKPPRTRPNWTIKTWSDLAEAFAPYRCGLQEKRYLRNLLLAETDQRLGVLPTVWQLLSQNNNELLTEESLHDQLQVRAPSCVSLLHAIRSYEAFARSLQDAFDLLRAEAATLDATGFEVTRIAKDSDFQQSTHDLHKRYATAQQALGEVTFTSVSLQNLFEKRFERFADPLDAGSCALFLCEQHERVQRDKSAAGKRPWFDRLGMNRIYVRHAYREKRRDIQPNSYLHDYRMRPIQRFYSDLT